MELDAQVVAYVEQGWAVEHRSWTRAVMSKRTLFGTRRLVFEADSKGRLARAEMRGKRVGVFELV